MITRNLIRLSLVALLAVVMLDCEPVEDIQPTRKARSGSIQLGEKLQNPYTVSNMQEAWNNVYKESKGIKLRPTHLYVKFIPKTEQELDLIKADARLELYSYPLDYEMPEGEGYYRAPDLPDDQPTYQYCALEVNYDFPHDVAYEVLEELYLPEEDRNSQGRSGPLHDLVNEALRLTGHEEEMVKSHSNAYSSWTPAGKITAWDGRIGSTTTITQVFDHWEYYDCGSEEDTPSTQKIIEPLCKIAVYKNVYNTSPGSHIPLIGVKVRARRWFTTHTGSTDANGDFSCNGTFKRPANYSIIWESSKYDIRDGLIGQALFNGPKKTGDWNLDISSGKSLRYATIHRAAYRYHYQNIGGLKRPKILNKLKISYMDAQGTGVNWGNQWQNFILGGAIPNIKIFGKDDLGYKTEDLVFRTTIHELGHASHIELMNAGLIQFGQVSVIIRESWADAIEWHITDIEYKYRGETDYSDPEANGNFSGGESHKQWWQPSNGLDYTPILIDMVDNWNQLAENGGNRPYDNVTGYTMGGMESGFMKHVYGVYSLGEELRSHKPNGVTNAQINTYLGFY